VNVRLLLDENLSERLLPLLADRFPASTHVRLIGLNGAEDRVIRGQLRSAGCTAVVSHTSCCLA